METQSTVTLWHPLAITPATLNIIQKSEVIPHDLLGRVSFKKLRELIGGYVELVRLEKEVLMFVDEDGHSKGLEFNPMGTMLYDRMCLMNGHGPTHFAVVGPIIVGARKEFEL